MVSFGEMDPEETAAPGFALSRTGGFVKAFALFEFAVYFLHDRTLQGTPVSKGPWWTGVTVGGLHCWGIKKIRVR